MASSLPFQIGQLVESRCFLIGYRGAWFRCKGQVHRVQRPRMYMGVYLIKKYGNELQAVYLKGFSQGKVVFGLIQIKDIGWRMGSLSYELEFIDFPDEEVIWTKPFQKPPAAFGIPSTGPKGQLMVRPEFPQLYREKQLSDVSINSQLEVTVVVNDVWKVGDLVDWWKDNCYWAGKIIAILGDEEVKVELLPPPFGEGLAYHASSKDLRPSLDWSPESGWMVPNMKVNGSTQCARVLNNGSVDLRTQNVSQENGSEAPAGTSNASLALQTTSMQPSHEPPRKLKRLHSDTASKEKHEHTPEVNANSNRVNSISKKTCTLENDSRLPAQKLDADGCNDGQSVKTTVPDVSLNSMQHHGCSLEDAILDLEELINRIKWTKQILEDGTDFPNASGSWKFVEPRPTSTPK